MATEAHKFQVGVFVIVSSFIGIGAAIWLGASRFFEKSVPFVTYFSESVQGLDTGAPVKYRGVPAGRVARIQVAPDSDLVEVRMDIDVEVAKVIESDQTMRATLELSGITGLRYIEVDRRVGDPLNQAPPLTFKPPAELIPSARSSFKAIQSALGDIYDKFMQVDTAGIASDARQMLQGANQLIRDQRISDTLTNLEQLSQSANRLVTNLDTATVKLPPTIDNAAQATGEAKQLFASLNTNMGGTQLRDTLDQLGRLAQSTQQFVLSLQATMDRLDRTVGNLQSLTEEVRNQPSLLLFSEPPTQRGPSDRGHR